MSTRGCIARATGEGTFTGVYHHWDSYPEALGKTLQELYVGHFNRDIYAMLAFLIDQHPAGWSTINECDFTQPPGFGENGFKSAGPQCYCHGGRHEEANAIDQDSDCGMEWAYVFDVEQRVLHVLERVYTDDAEGTNINTGEKASLAGKHMVGMFGYGAEGHQRWKDVEAIELDKLGKAEVSQ